MLLFFCAEANGWENTCISDIISVSKRLEKII